MTTRTTSTANKTSEKSEEASSPAPIVLDLGKQRRRHIRRLRNGRGRLMEALHSSLAELQDQGHCDAGAQPVIVVVQPKKKKKNGFGLPGLWS